MLPKMDERGKINALSSRIAKMYTLMLLVTLRVCDFGRGKIGWAKCGKSLKSKKSSHALKKNIQRSKHVCDFQCKFIGSQMADNNNKLVLAR